MSSEKSQSAQTVLQDPRWQAILRRDPNADGSFYYSVKSTGVYCRPSCPARVAKPENVQFHHSCEAAEQAGFRPCKRCKPRQESLHSQHARMVVNICAYIDASDQPPPLDELAARAGLSSYYFHRLFKSITGLTPRAYATAQRNRRIRLELQGSATITNAIFDAGYSSSSRFYENAEQILGMTPGDYRAGGSNNEIRFALGECSLGSILVAQSDRGVCAISLGDDPETLLRELQDRFAQASLIGADAEFEQRVAHIIAYVEAPGIGLELPLDIRGTAFQQRVWQALREIPAGATASYSEVAQRIGSPAAVRAVASACAANTLAVAIPCHRVVRQDGKLSGYRWGIERKRSLLDREQTLASALASAQATEPVPDGTDQSDGQ